MQGVHDLRGGPGVLLARSLPQPAPIVIVDSRESFWLNEVDPVFPGNTLPSQAAWLALLEALGHPCQFVSADSLRDATLADAQAVVLPMCRAMDDEAWRVIENFAAGGGLVIADLLPATHNALGVPRASSSVARLFGVVTSPNAGPQSIDEDADSIPEDWNGLLIDSTVQPGDAVASDASGMGWLVHTVDAGTRILLNQPLLHFDVREPDDASAQLRDWLAAELMEAGMEPAVRLSDGDQLPPGTEFARHLYGDARIIALLGPGGTRRPPRVALDLGEDGHVYEPRTGVRHGNPARVRVHLDDTHAALLTVLPYRVDSIDLVSPAEVVAGRRLELVARLQARDGLPGRHLFRVEVSSLEGEVLDHYTRHLEAPEGMLRTYIPFARNEQPGWYRVTVRDLLSGTAAESRFVVLPRT